MPRRHDRPVDRHRGQPGSAQIAFTKDLLPIDDLAVPDAIEAWAGQHLDAAAVCGARSPEAVDKIALNLCPLPSRCVRGPAEFVSARVCATQDRARLRTRGETCVSPMRSPTPHHRRRLPLPRQRPARHHRRRLEPPRRRSRPTTARLDQQRRLRHLLTCDRLDGPRRRRRRQPISSKNTKASIPAAIRPRCMINRPTRYSKITHPAALDLDRQRALIDTLMTVELLRVPSGRKQFDPTRCRSPGGRSRAGSEWGICSFLARHPPVVTAFAHGHLRLHCTRLR